MSKAPPPRVVSLELGTSEFSCEAIVLKDVLFCKLESLIESELFGHEKGAFTGASSSNQGLIASANKGTLFLDEIGELPLEAQARLLRVIQEQEIRKVGSTQSITVDIRVISATHRNLKELVTQGKFREDLFYRLQVIELNLPALRERGTDILLLAKFLIKKHSAKLGLTIEKTLSSDASELINQYNWPGNVRELENALQRALILADGNEIDSVDLAIDMTDIEIQNPNSNDMSLEIYFKNFVLEHQKTCSETELAQKLGISRKCLWERRQRFNIPRHKKNNY